MLGIELTLISVYHAVALAVLIRIDNSFGIARIALLMNPLGMSLQFHWRIWTRDCLANAKNTTTRTRKIQTFIVSCTGMSEDAIGMRLSLHRCSHTTDQALGQKSMVEAHLVGETVQRDEVTEPG
jgi:hypothetical protein